MGEVRATNDAASPAASEADVVAAASEAYDPDQTDEDADGPHDRSGRSDRHRYTRAVTIGGLLAFVPFLAVLWDFGVAPLRSALPQRFFSHFYDLQARAFMDGHLYVPKGSLSIEGFVVDGRDYMYFPPFPAILRVPVLWIGGSGLDGRLTAPSILVAWLITTVLIALLLWRIRCILRPDAPLGSLEAWCYGAFVLTATGGSILVFIAALPWVYHEAYAWGIAGAIGTLYCLIGVIERPRLRGAVATGCWAIVAILSRTTSGWACCIAILMCSVWFLLGRRGAGAKSLWWATALAGLIPLTIGASVNFAKFRHPWLFPLDRQVWTQVNEHRRDALAANGGGLVGPQFFTTSLVNYFRPDGIRFTSIFPWVSLPAEPARGYNGAFVDQAYRTGSVTAFMPGLFALAICGLVMTFRRGAGARLAWFRFPLLGALGITAGVMFYGYMAHRYTAEFFPILVLAGAIATVVLAGRSIALSTRWAWGVGALVAVLTAYSVVVNVAPSVYAARTTAGGTQLRDFVVVQERLSDLTGDPLSAYVDQSDSLPADAPPDRLHIVGDCEALYLSTGDTYQPWLPVELREVVMHVGVLERDDDAPPLLGSDGTLTLLRFDGVTNTTVTLQRLGRSAFRIIVEDGDVEDEGPIFTAPPGSTFDVAVRINLSTGQYRLETPNFWALAVPNAGHADDWITHPTSIVPVDIDASDARERGVMVDVDETPVPELCAELRGSDS